MGFRIPVKAATKAFLAGEVIPQSVPGGQAQAEAWVLYDTQDYLAAGSAALTFFQNINADKTLSNMEGGAQLPDPQYFQIYYMLCDILVPSFKAGAGGGPWSNMSEILIEGRPTFEFTISQKVTGPFPLTFAHASGGLTGFGYNEAAVGVSAPEYANNGTFDGGWCIDGSIIIPPKTGFSITVRWGNPLAVTANTPIRFNLAGVLHRKVL